jgi:hypothetical protein
LVKLTATGVTYGYDHASHHYNHPSGDWRRMVRPRTLVLNELHWAGERLIWAQQAWLMAYTSGSTNSKA